MKCVVCGEKIRHADKDDPPVCSKDCEILRTHHLAVKSWATPQHPYLTWEHTEN